MRPALVHPHGHACEGEGRPDGSKRHEGTRHIIIVNHPGPTDVTVPEFAPTPEPQKETHKKPKDLEMANVYIASSRSLVHYVHDIIFSIGHSDIGF